jgi:hypothetical protein
MYNDDQPKRCNFLQITKVADKTYTVNMTIVYAPSVASSTDIIMNLVRKRFTSQNISNLFFGFDQNISMTTNLIGMKMTVEKEINWY